MKIAKAVRRNQTVDEAFMDKLYSDITALYRLDQIGGQNHAQNLGKTELGKLPAPAIALLTILVVVWLIIIVYVSIQYVKRRKKYS